jgi:hypothetical protein
MENLSMASKIKSLSGVERLSILNYYRAYTGYLYPIFAILKWSAASVPIWQMEGDMHRIWY